MLISSIFVNNYVNDYIISEFYPNRIVEAIQIDYIPTESIPFSRLESYDIRTIFDSGTGAIISFKDRFEIFELMDIYDGPFVKYNDNYYRLQFDIAGEGVSPIIPLPFIALTWLVSLIIIISVLLISIIIIIKILNILGRAFPFG